MSKDKKISFTMSFLPSVYEKEKEGYISILANFFKIGSYNNFPSQQLSALDIEPNFYVLSFYNENLLELLLSTFSAEDELEDFNDLSMVYSKEEIFQAKEKITKSFNIFSSHCLRHEKEQSIITYQNSKCLNVLEIKTAEQQTSFIFDSYGSSRVRKIILLYLKKHHSSFYPLHLSYQENLEKF